ncbi:MAG TPA: hypothetical protein VGD91_23605 [Trebonia sp.]
MTGQDDACWVDADYERDHTGRLAVYVRTHIDEFTRDPAAFAAAAFAAATAPVMVPGYVRFRPPIMSVSVTCTPHPDDGGLAVTVTTTGGSTRHLTIPAGDLYVPDPVPEPIDSIDIDLAVRPIVAALSDLT